LAAMGGAHRSSAASLAQEYRGMQNRVYNDPLWRKNLEAHQVPRPPPPEHSGHKTTKRQGNYVVEPRGTFSNEFRKQHMFVHSTFRHVHETAQQDAQVQDRLRQQQPLVNKGHTRCWGKQVEMCDRGDSHPPVPSYLDKYPDMLKHMTLLPQLQATPRPRDAQTRWSGSP